MTNHQKKGQDNNHDQLQHHDLGGKVVSAFRWLTAVKFFGQMINWGITFYVIRLLAPSEYGLMAMATVFIEFLTLFNEFGLGAAVIQAKEIERQTLQQMFALILCLNAGLGILLYSASPLIALFFREPQVVPIIKLLSVEFLFVAVSIIPDAILTRNLDFKKKSVVDFAANLSGGVCTLLLAMAGKGVWALVWGNLVIFSFRAIGLNLLSPFWVRPIFSFTGMRSFISFGSYIILERIVWYFYSRVDVLIVGRILGKEALGFYTVGKEFASLPSIKISPIINQVLFPAFSRIQGDAEKVAQYFSKGNRMLSMFAFPVFMGICSVAPETIRLVLGAKWQPAIVPMILVSVVIPLSMLNLVISIVLKSVGRVDRSFQLMLMAAAFMPTAFLIGSQWGIVGVSLAWTIGYPLYFFMTCVRSARFFSLRVVDIFIPMLIPLVSSAIMVSAVFAMKALIRGVFPAGLELAIYCLTGAVVYFVCIILLDRNRLTEVMALVKR